MPAAVSRLNTTSFGFSGFAPSSRIISYTEIGSAFVTPNFSVILRCRKKSPYFNVLLIQGHKLNSIFKIIYK